MSTVAVLDIGKTNVKLTVATRDGVILETVSAANSPVPGPPYLHSDLAGIEGWFFDQLRELAPRYDIGFVVATGHGIVGTLVDDDGALMPIIDYEAELPREIDREYARLAGTLQERGSPIVPGAGHQARHLLWLETEWPDAVARARFYLGMPQYWAFRLSGVAANELTYLGAQSHLWDVRRRRFTPIVAERGWQRLMPPLRPAWTALGALKPDLATRHGITGNIQVLCGIHDSSANFYRYQQAGFGNLSLISTGTFIVGLADIARPAEFVVTNERICNADVEGRPLAGVLAMGGREFAIIAGEDEHQPVARGDLLGVVEAGTLALPSFANRDGPFPGSALRGRIIGPQPETPRARRALALLYVALLTEACLDVIGRGDVTVLDGSFVKDPLYASLVAALQPGHRLLFSTDAYGTAAGTALLADHERRRQPVAIDLKEPESLDLPGFKDYRDRWRSLAAENGRTAASMETGR